MRYPFALALGILLAVISAATLLWLVSSAGVEKQGSKTASTSGGSTTRGGSTTTSGGSTSRSRRTPRGGITTSGANDRRGGSTTSGGSQPKTTPTPHRPLQGPLQPLRPLHRAPPLYLTRRQPCPLMCQMCHQHPLSMPEGQSVGRYQS
jgi:hypothetical protein